MFQPGCSIPPSSNFRPYQRVNSPSFHPRAPPPTRTPYEPDDSVLVRPNVPAMCPTPASVMPTRTALARLRTNPPGPEVAPNECVENSRENGLRPRMTLVRALHQPEQSYPPGPTPP